MNRCVVANFTVGIGKGVSIFSGSLHESHDDFLQVDGPSDFKQYIASMSFGVSMVA